MSDKEAKAPKIINMGKYSRKRVRRLKKGKGRLMDDISDAMQELQEAKEVAADAQPIVVIVRQKRRGKYRGIF